MDLEDVKAWQWSLLGLVAGLVVSYAWTAAGPQRDAAMRRPITVDALITRLHAHEIRNLVIQPQEQRQNLVTGELSVDDRSIPFTCYVEVPMVAKDVQADSIVAYVQAEAAKDPLIRLKFPWWRARWFAMSCAGLAGAFVVGGIWPVTIRVMRGAPMFPPKVVEDHYDLSRFDPSVELEKKLHPSLEIPDLDIELQPPSVEGEIAKPEATAVKKLEEEELQPVAPEPEEHKEYRGEFYPVEKPHAFTLVELIVVIGVIGILIAFLIPSLTRARQSVKATACANNLRQISVALQAYLNDNQLMTFWRGKVLDRDGMDWYGYGGRETGNGNLGFSNYFNRVTRPLNRYVANKLEVFRCPNDDIAPWTLDLNNTIFPASSQFDWVGNSYNFNANGYPFRPWPRYFGGLDGERFTSISDTSNTIVFFEACLYWGSDWHFSHKGNFAFADGHVSFMAMPSRIGQYRWDP